MAATMAVIRACAPPAAAATSSAAPFSADATKRKKSSSARVLVLGGTGRVGGSTATALSKLRPDFSILVGGRNRSAKLPPHILLCPALFSDLLFSSAPIAMGVVTYWDAILLLGRKVNPLLLNLGNSLNLYKLIPEMQACWRRRYRVSNHTYPVIN